MLEWITERLLTLAGQLGTLQKDQRDLRDNALRSVSHALNETCLYYRDLGQGRTRNLDVEAQLSRYWSAAAIPIRHLDPEMAHICDEKSEYWLDPENWNAADIQRAGIGLASVRDRYRSMLYPGLYRLQRHRSDGK